MKLKKNILTFGFLLFVFLIFCSGVSSPVWGFFGHRKINRMAVFTLPQELIPLYRKNIEFITEHAVAPDKRRYATKREAARHYIDIDHWGAPPFDELPWDFVPALVNYSDVIIVNDDNDRVRIFGHDIAASTVDSIKIGESNISKSAFIDSITPFIVKAYYSDKWEMECGDLEKIFDIVLPNCESIFIVDSLSMFGIIPYHMWVMQKRLQKAFESRNINQVIRTSAEFGHYIADAHVPLHTTENYNGQLTGQDGLHAFWESRIPELFANDEFDFFVGGAKYINDPKMYFWDIIFESFSLVNSVLEIEKRIRSTFPSDLQFCYEERLDRTIRTQCKAYAKEYFDEMDGMVERRMQDAISAVGNLWFTAWVNAGQPDITGFGDFELTPEQQKEMEKENELYKRGVIYGRRHSN